MGIKLQIDQLVLDGFDPCDRHAIARAVERELGRLIAAEGAPRSFEVRGPVEFRMDQRMAPGAVGSRIAQSVYRGFKGHA
jgi:hypothetical protein